MQYTQNYSLKKPDGTDVVNISDLNNNADIIDAELAKRLLNTGGITAFLSGTDANKPTAGTAGRIYFATDTQIVYFDTGSAWQKTGIANWKDIIGTPSTFTPSAHKSTHATGGADALTPADIGAVNKAGDTMTGALFALGSANEIGVGTTLSPGPQNGTIRFTSNGNTGTSGAYIEYYPPSSGDTTRILNITGNNASNLDYLKIAANIVTVNGNTVWHAGNTHKTTHAIGGSDVLLPTDIGALTVLSTSKTINVPNDYATLQAALDSLKNVWIPKDVTVTIQVAAGNYAITSPITINHPCGNQIQIIGANPVKTTISSIGTVSGSAGNYSVPINVASAAGMAVGQIVIVSNVTGSGNYSVINGAWKITAISGNQITVTNTFQGSSFPSVSVSGGNVACLQTIIQANGCHGIVLSGGTTLGNISNVAIIGNGTAGYNGLYVGYVPISGNIYDSPAIISYGTNLGINGFGNSGVFINNHGSLLAGLIASSNNGSNGFVAGQGSTIYAISPLISTGNKISGFIVSNGSSISASSSTASGNGTYGFAATAGGAIYATNSTASGNANSDYYVWLESSIYASGYAGSPAFSPAINTVGNQNSIIST
jgi:hypothetical protein